MSNSGPGSYGKEPRIYVPHDLILRIGLKLADGDEEAQDLAGELGEHLPSVITARVTAARDTGTPSTP